MAGVEGREAMVENNGIGNRIEGLKQIFEDPESFKKFEVGYWRPTYESKWKRQPWWSPLFIKDLMGRWHFGPWLKLVGWLRRTILPVPWKKNPEYGPGEGIVATDDIELEWRIPCGYGFEQIFSPLALWWAEDRERRDFFTRLFAVWHIRDMEYRMHYKPTELELEWYKYPFRSASANRPFTRRELRKVVADCIEAATDA